MGHRVATVVGLALTSIASFRRVVLLKDEKSGLFLFMTAYSGCLLFGAGEEIPGDSAFQHPKL